MGKLIKATQNISVSMLSEYTDVSATLESLLVNPVAQRLLLNGGLILQCKSCGFFVCTGCKKTGTTICHIYNCWEDASVIDDY